MKNMLLVLATVLVAQPAFALTLKEKKQLAAWNEQVKGADSHVAQVKQKCGFDLAVSLDEKMLAPFMAENTSAAAYCDSGASAIAGLCEDPASKAEIVKKVKKVDCKNGKAGEAAIALKGSTLEIAVGPGTSNLDEKVKTFLENNL
jgi:hypothetical protein